MATLRPFFSAFLTPSAGQNDERFVKMTVIVGIQDSAFVACFYRPIPSYFKAVRHCHFEVQQ